MVGKINSMDGWVLSLLLFFLRVVLRHLVKRLSHGMPENSRFVLLHRFLLAFLYRWWEGRLHGHAWVNLGSERVQVAGVGLTFMNEDRLEGRWHGLLA